MTNQEDRKVLNTLMLVVGALVVFFVVAVIAARIVSAPSVEKATGPDSMVEAAIIDRIKPYGEVNVGTAPVAVASSGADGKGTYTSACFACHGTGAAGAPKLGDKGAWKSRIAQGEGTLFDHSINGFTGKTGIMPPKGGNMSLSDAAVKAAVQYMVDGSK